MCSLTLQPYGKQSFTVDLSESSGRRGSIEQIIERSIDRYIFSDLSYEFILLCESQADVQEVSVYINDVYEPSVYENGKIMFPGKGASDKRIFIDCYGFVEISLDIYQADGSQCQYVTDFLPVLVRRGELNNAVKDMVNYVYSNQELLLLNGEPKATNPTNMKESGYQNLSAHIILAEEIASIYENSYGYFKANSQFKIDKISQIDRFEHLQYVTPATVQYIVTHPEELRRTSSYSGIRVGNIVYQPERTLLVENKRSYDTYENRVVLGFIRKMIDSVNQLCEHCNDLLKQIPNNENYGDEYIYSSFFMFTETKRTLENGLNRLMNLRAKFASLWEMYTGAMRIKKSEVMLNEPRPSQIFLSVPQYNRIFIEIYKWFRFGIYDFTRENFMLSFIKISSLYEGYLLAKFIAYFKNRGYKLENIKKCTYPTKRNWKYKNTTCSNTFFFKNEKHKLTLYYQPVIYDTDESSVNGIGLTRNNSIYILDETATDRQSGGHYYSPDYLIKVECDSYVRYLILDAKFSDLACVRKYYVRELAFKYLFSISPIQPTDTIAGLGIIYGKCSNLEQMQSVYDKQLPNQKIEPIADLLPLIEGVANDKHYSNLDALMRAVVAFI